MRLIACITDFRHTSRILEHIGEQSIRPPPLTAKTSPPGLWRAEAVDSTPDLELYDIAGVYTGYYPYSFWLLAMGFDMPGSWWDPIGEGEPNFWVVLGVDQSTGAYAFSDPGTFTKAGECSGQCCGTYTFDCGGSSICVCYTTTEGDTACGPDFSCSALATCGSSADCGVGERCLACTCCANPNVCAPVDEALCAEGFSSFKSYEEGPTTTGLDR